MKRKVTNLRFLDTVNQKKSEEYAGSMLIIPGLHEIRMGNLFL